MKYLTNSALETKKLGQQIASQLTGGEVVCLYGELGVGKTVFVQGMIEYFLPEKRVLSPTFIIVRHYQINDKEIKRFIHVDLYRINDIKEVKELEFLEFLERFDTIVAIEWAEKMKNLLPKKRLDIHIKLLKENQRMIYVKP